MKDAGNLPKNSAKAFHILRQELEARCFRSFTTTYCSMLPQLSRKADTYNREEESEKKIENVFNSTLPDQSSHSCAKRPHQLDCRGLVFCTFPMANWQSSQDSEATALYDQIEFKQRFQAHQCFFPSFWMVRRKPISLSGSWATASCRLLTTEQDCDGLRPELHLHILVRKAPNLDIQDPKTSLVLHMIGMK